MKPFFVKILLYLTLISGLVLLYILLIYMRPELVDAYYYRFTTEKSNSLILGGSRAAQGIKPEVINKLICNNENKIINHSFALGASSFGPNYLKEITKKLKKESTNGCFIIEVVPWSLATDIGNVNDDSTKFYEVEQKVFVGNLKSSSTNPNFDYLVNHWSNKFEPITRIFKTLTNIGGISTLHADGWLEITTAMDSASNNDRIRRSTNEYQDKELKLSDTRFLYLEKIIRYLDDYGDIVLVRMPVSAQMAKIEKDHFPDFKERIKFISVKYNIPFFDFIDESGKFLTIDTHHLYKEESQRFTSMLCDSIISYSKSKYSAEKLATVK